MSPTTFWHDSNVGDRFAEWLRDVAYTINPPLVHSIAWGVDEQYVSIDEFDSFEIAAMRLGLMGVTLVVASGDEGVHTDIGPGDSLEYCGYVPSYPATSNYVLSVGGTMVRNSL